MKIVGLFLVFLVSAHCGETKNGLMQQQSASDWIPLFDGSSFEHWRGYLSDTMYDEWTIEEGAMAFARGKTGAKNIITKEKFTNFILSIEWKISEGGNSGILWGVFEDNEFREAHDTGPEIQVLDNDKHPDGKFPGGFHSAGSLYDMMAPVRDVTKPVGDWNHCLIEINHRTNSGKVILNGIELHSFPVHGAAWDEMVNNSKFKDWKGFGKHRTGHIGLQDHGDKVWYRNIKIKDLGE